MNPSSRTPEGTPFHCALCGNDALIELSCFPVRDATCPSCGHLAQPVSADSKFPRPLIDTPASSIALTAANRFLREDDHPHEPFSTFERRSWTILAVVSATIVLANDGLLNGAIWLLAMFVVARFIVPRLFRWAHARTDACDNLCLDGVVGWALVPGPPVGILFGTTLPLINDCGVSSLTGGFMGLLVGPCLAAIQGLTIVSFVGAVFWLVTGRRLTKHDC